MDIIRFVQDEMRDTSDEWYPNYPGNQVRISVSRLMDGEFRVCVWGADDFGMEIDVKTKSEAMIIYKSLPPVISQEYLKVLGFVRA